MDVTSKVRICIAVLSIYTSLMQNQLKSGFEHWMNTPSKNFWEKSKCLLHRIRQEDAAF